ncbi:MAG: hypothetical protein ACFE8Z_11620, partial [Candidatus Hermodarchaeota archaeon]
LESFSWHEITLLLFSDAYRKFSTIIPQVRELTLGQLKNNLRKSLYQDELSVYDKANDSLISYLIRFDSKRKERLSALRKDEDASHIIVNSTSIVGFDFEIFKDIALEEKENSKFKSLDLIKREDRIRPVSKWFTKGGHFKASINMIMKKRNNVEVCLGRGDLIHPHPAIMPTREFIREVVKTRTNKDAGKHIISVYTIPVIKTNIEKLPKISTTRHFYLRILNRLAIDIKKIKSLNECMVKLWMPKILTERLANMIAIFNQGIQDPLLYASFVELRPLIQYIIKTIEQVEKGAQVENLSEILDKVVTSFETAYRNRFHLSYSMGEITDYNLEFKGGIQQLVTAYDGLYKAVSRVLGNPKSFIFVGGNPHIETTDWALQLNFFHIFQPEFLGATAIHEAANHFLSKRSHQNLPRLIRFTSESRGANNELSKAINESYKRNRSKCNDYLINFIRPEFFSKLFSDFLTYYLGYGGNSLLYQFWHWNFFATSPVCYLGPNIINKDYFIHFILRQLVIARTCDEKFFDRYKIEFGESLKALANENLDSVKAFVDFLLEAGSFKDWCEETASFAQDKFFNAFEDVLVIHSKQKSDRLRTIRDYLDKKAEEIKGLFLIGEVPIYERVNRISGFKYAQKLLYAYLKLIMNDWGKGVTILRRKEENGMPDFSDSVKGRYSKLLFDPRGGTFLYDPETRRQYLQYRFIFTMALWDMAVKEKRHYILDQLSKSH